MKILWYSNAPFAATGYGQQTAVWLPRLASLGHEVAACGALSFSGAPLNWNNVVVYPGWRDGIGNDILGGHYHHFKADLLVTLCDAFVLDPNLVKAMNVLHWMPVDCYPMNWRDQGVLKAGKGTPVAMSKFGKAEMEKAGFSPFWIPHGIDIKVFSPADRQAARKVLGVSGDTFCIGMNVYNKDVIRKGFPEQFLAFEAFHKKHPDSKLFVHSAMSDPSSVDLQALAAACHVSDAVVFADQYAYASGMIQPEHLAMWYNAMDAVSCCTFGEGFGLPIIEAQACGTPVVVTDASAMSELAGPGIKVPGTKFWVPAHRGWWTRPDVSKIAKAYETLYALKHGLPAASRGKFRTMDEMRAACREHAAQYDADTILTTHWQPVLEKVQAGL